MNCNREPLRLVSSSSSSEETHDVEHISRILDGSPRFAGDIGVFCELYPRRRSESISWTIPATMSWQQKSQAKREALLSAIPQEWKLSPEDVGGRTKQRRVVDKIGKYLSTSAREITEMQAKELLEKLQTGDRTAGEVLVCEPSCEPRALFLTPTLPAHRPRSPIVQRSLINWLVIITTKASILAHLSTDSLLERISLSRCQKTSGSARRAMAYPSKTDWASPWNAG